jgi:hypothetical protein
VDEHIIPGSPGDESKAFCCVEPFDCSFFHGTGPFLLQKPISTDGQGVRRVFQLFLWGGVGTLEGHVRQSSRTSPAVYNELTIQERDIAGQFLRK